MTNGEKIVNTFYGKVSKTDGVVYFSTDGWIHAYADEWWNSEYKEPTTKNDLGVDCISRTSALDSINWAYNLGDAYQKINDLPSVTPQEPQTFKWCTDCKEYDQEKHCCHRWSKVIRDTVEEMKQEPRWIPVSERLPEESGMYLVSGRWKNEPYEVWICEFMYLGELKGWANDAKRPIVTAWMPLPKHREVESEET